MVDSRRILYWSQYLWASLLASFDVTLQPKGSAIGARNPQKCPKWLGEGAKGLLGQGRQSPPKSLLHHQNPVYSRRILLDHFSTVCNRAGPI